jgi:hypothetical protein
VKWRSMRRSSCQRPRPFRAAPYGLQPTAAQITDSLGCLNASTVRFDPTSSGCQEGVQVNPGSSSSNSLGPDTKIGPFAVLSVGMIEGQDGLDTGPRGAEPIVTVGERCGFGRYFQLIAHLHVEIGDVTWFAPVCYVNAGA